MEECGNRKDDTQPSLSSSIVRRRRRLVQAEFSESEPEEAAKDPDNSIDAVNPVGADHEEDEPRETFLQDVTETNKEADASDVDQPDENEDESESDAENRKGSGDKVNVADFDDEEEFLLAGGDVEDAKKRKEWFARLNFHLIWLSPTNTFVQGIAPV